MRNCHWIWIVFLLVILVVIPSSVYAQGPDNKTGENFDQRIVQNVEQMFLDGRRIFRFDTFGDEAFWGDTLRLHEAVAGEANGGVGPGVSPNAALALGLKVDVEALPQPLVNRLRRGEVDLDDPATTLALLQLDAVVGVKGFFGEEGDQSALLDVQGMPVPQQGIQSIGITCALCHSTVNDSFAPGIGERLDGWANRDLNVGAIIAAAPNLSPFVELLSVVQPDIGEDGVRDVLSTWGPGKFDAELILDGKAFQPDGSSAATLIPDAYDLAGYNECCWTGAWGTITYWNAFVANLEMHGVGTFYDPRFDDAEKFPIAAAKGFGHVRADPTEDQITPKLPALHYYQLSLPAPQPSPGVHFDPSAAERGYELFNGKAQCGTCHVDPLWTEPGWNLHTPEEIGIDSFQAERAPDNVYKTMNLSGVFVSELGIFMKPENKGRFYHDGRFATLQDVVNHYDSFFGLGLTAEEVNDLVEFLKSL